MHVCAGVFVSHNTIGSEEQVRDLVHPSMYPYVDGVSVCAKKRDAVQEDDTSEKRLV